MFMKMFAAVKSAFVSFFGTVKKNLDVVLMSFGF